MSEPSYQVLCMGRSKQHFDSDGRLGSGPVEHFGAKTGTQVEIHAHTWLAASAATCALHKMAGIT